MHVYKVGHFGLNIIAEKGRIKCKYRRNFKETYKNQSMFKVQMNAEYK